MLRDFALMPAPRLPSLFDFAWPPLAVAAAFGCGDAKLKKVAEPFQLVAGEPGVDRGAPTLDAAPPKAAADGFADNAPAQLDAFDQVAKRQVDILWIVDDSPSMDVKQKKLAHNFQAFVQVLATATPPIDFHLGIVTTDTYAPTRSGRLVNGPGGTAALPQPYIVGGPDVPGVEQHTADPVGVFGAWAVGVGTHGSGDEKGLLALEEALTPPLNAPGGANAHFFRDTASFYAVLLSDEDDSSCEPLAATANNGEFEGCTPPEAWGAADHYARLVRGFKGPGRSGDAAFSAIVATSGDSFTCDPASMNCTNGWTSGVGCTLNDASGAFVALAWFGQRYVAVAQSTGGVATSICDADYTPALSKLGFAVSGLKSRFPLSRAPVEASLHVSLKPHGAAASALPRDPAHQNGWDWVKCDASGARENAVETFGNAVPPADARLVVEYGVNVQGVTCP